MDKNNSQDARYLFTLIGQGSEEAFTTLFHTYKHKLYGYIMSTTNSSEQADDLVQEIFLKIWRNREELSSVDNPEAYFFRTARNHVVDAVRRMARQTRLLAHMRDQAALSTVANRFKGLEDKEVTQIVQKVIDKLPTQQRMVYILSREKGMKYQEISQCLKISTGTVKNHMVQALRTIKKELKQHPEWLPCAVLLVHVL